MPARFTASEIPDQSGRLAIVTGANSGLGLITARELAHHGASVVIACRNLEKGERAAAEVERFAPDSSVAVEQLDLADLASVSDFAKRIGDAHPAVDLLVNNAGVMAPPRRETVDGFEQQLGTNHLGHFALTGLILPKLLAATAPRVVTLTSVMHRIGRIAFEDLHGEQRYGRWRAYGQSKLANLMFAGELARRAAAAGSPLVSAAAHPGYAATNLQFAGPPGPEAFVLGIGNRLFAQSAASGALPSLYAATVPDLPNGAFVGPGGVGELRGDPRLVSGSRASYDQETWKRLWEVSEELTGVRYDFRAAVAGSRD